MAVHCGEKNCGPRKLILFLSLPSLFSLVYQFPIFVAERGGREKAKLLVVVVLGTRSFENPKRNDVTKGVSLKIESPANGLRLIYPLTGWYRRIFPRAYVGTAREVGVKLVVLPGRRKCKWYCLYP